MIQNIGGEMEPLVRFIEIVKDLSMKKLIAVTIVFMILLSIWKIDVIITHFKPLINHEKISEPSTVRLISKEDLSISTENLKNIKEYSERYLNQLGTDAVFASIYKFLPEGNEYLYQGRVLVHLSSTDSTLADIIDKELNLAWIPIWSGKTVVERILTGNLLYLKFDKKSREYKFYSSEHKEINNQSLEIKSGNLPLLVELGVLSIQYHPILNSDQVVGYIVIYLNKENYNIASVTETLNRLSVRLSPYLVSNNRRKS